MTASEKLIRINIDTARISETKVEWLLKFNKYKVPIFKMEAVALEVHYYFRRTTELPHFKLSVYYYESEGEMISLEN